jgi:hypothetical protein
MTSTTSHYGVQCVMYYQQPQLQLQAFDNSVCIFVCVFDCQKVSDVPHGDSPDYLSAIVDY